MNFHFKSAEHAKDNTGHGSKTCPWRNECNKAVARRIRLGKLHFVEQISIWGKKTACQGLGTYYLSSSTEDEHFDLEFSSSSNAYSKMQSRTVTHWCCCCRCCCKVAEGTTYICFLFCARGDSSSNNAATTRRRTSRNWPWKTCLPSMRSRLAPKPHQSRLARTQNF